jgi:hypothetical protein
MLIYVADFTRLFWAQPFEIRLLEYLFHISRT